MLERLLGALFSEGVWFSGWSISEEVLLLLKLSRDSDRCVIDEVQLGTKVKPKERTSSFGREIGYVTFSVSVCGLHFWHFYFCIRILGYVKDK